MSLDIPISLTDGVKVVSFDVFDTLIKRNLKKPTDVFYIVYSQTLRRTGVDCNGFVSVRIAAEKEARRNCPQEEVRLEDIYTQVAKKRPSWPIERLISIEREVEINVAARNVPIYRFYKKCVDIGLRVVATSDMYLDEETIRLVLAKCGYSCIETVFVSSEVGLRKSSGKLFQHVIDACNIAPNAFLHLGDNPTSDFKIPRELGCKAYLYREDVKPKVTFASDGGTRNLALNSFLSNTAETGDEFFYSVGRGVLGPVLLGFSEWLHEYIVGQKPEVVAFLSRDGAIMKKAYERLFGVDDRIKYAYCSRRGIIVPTIYSDCTLASIQDRIHFKNRMKIGDVLDRVGLDAKDCSSELASAGLDFDTEVDGTHLADDKRICKLFGLLSQKIYDNSLQEHDSALVYWRDVLDDAKTVFIVDIGWNGNMQRALSQLLNELNSIRPLRIAGFYLGVNPWSTYDGEMHGYLFEKRNHESYAKRIRYFMSIVELMFMADHGSLLRYQPHGQVSLCNYEYDNLSKANVQTGAAIESIQRGALSFIDEYGNSCLDSYCPITKDDARGLLLALGEKPSPESAEMFGDCLFFNTALEPIAKPLSRKFSFDEFVRTSWRVGYLQRCLNRNLPYGVLVRLMDAISSILGNRK